CSLSAPGLVWRGGGAFPSTRLSARTRSTASAASGRSNCTKILIVFVPLKRLVSTRTMTPPVLPGASSGFDGALPAGGSCAAKAEAVAQPHEIRTPEIRTGDLVVLVRWKV